MGANVVDGQIGCQRRSQMSGPTGRLADAFPFNGLLSLLYVLVGPTDRGKPGSKNHLLVDHHGLPLHVLLP
jgi:hypothetical protein